MSVLTGRGRDSYEGLRERLERSERENAGSRDQLAERERVDDLAKLERDEAQEQARREATDAEITRRWLHVRKVEAEAAEQLARRRGITVPAGASTASIVALLRADGEASS
ncbi:MAG TPA: hypothetical protein VKG38_03515 [Solirubrobacteraceae bacterium]|nr:hypothetical protein [Solirubrobacteraceae bacterium]